MTHMKNTPTVSETISLAEFGTLFHVLLDFPQLQAPNEYRITLIWKAGKPNYGMVSIIPAGITIQVFHVSVKTLEDAALEAATLLSFKH